MADELGLGFISTTDFIIALIVFIIILFIIWIIQSITKARKDFGVVNLALNKR